MQTSGSAPILQPSAHPLHAPYNLPWLHHNVSVNHLCPRAERYAHESVLKKQARFSNDNGPWMFSRLRNSEKLDERAVLPSLAASVVDKRLSLKKRTHSAHQGACQILVRGLTGWGACSSWGIYKDHGANIMAGKQKFWWENPNFPAYEIKIAMETCDLPCNSCSDARQRRARIRCHISTRRLPTHQEHLLPSFAALDCIRYREDSRQCRKCETEPCSQASRQMRPKVGCGGVGVGQPRTFRWLDKLSGYPPSPPRSWFAPPYRTTTSPPCEPKQRAHHSERALSITRG